MGVRALGLIENRLADHRDRGEVVFRLSPSLPQTLAVQDYWHSVQDYDDTGTVWVSDPVERSERDLDWLSYNGPGSFHVRFKGALVLISAGCRWSGFSTIRRLHSVHVAAFRSIACALGADRLALLPDSNPIEDEICGGVPLEKCISLLSQHWGPPQLKMDIVTEDDKVYYNREVPPWYLEDLKSNAQ